ncbi:DKNYY domain-containing protein [Candidatus Symbiopectobacterium sp. NZEC127]|uniref:DKNYY domain-containing protein n=1 Tax=Candidatus Symbiopectobacterium sp. NZEC127 TaxID=2820472 RepID=UPI002227D2A4|nr:DKNYY domain-containing protein [Candidatus Symbiopectobacterium sp. NZEC127]MCW2485189.1 DKNYY domain-containing protein [Candidatus Symbiopectobacterium sp. NZEC127]
MRKGTLNLCMALIGGVFGIVHLSAIAAEKTAVTYSNVKYPYKVIDGVLHYQSAANLPAVPMKNVKPESFSVIYSDTAFGVGKANDTYYCNATALPKAFNPENAKAIDSYLVSEVGTYAYCNKMTVNIDWKKFEALDFPFFSDGKHIFMRDGSVLKGADVATFQTKGTNQAFDKKHYYFRESNSAIVPYKKSVNIFEQCFGWATIDDALYFRGEKNSELDASTFTCLSFSVTADKKGFYIYGKPFPIFTADTDVKNLKALSDYVVTDGKSVWFVKIEPERLAGLDASKVTVDENVISDGVNEWQCGDFKSPGEAMCTKQ